LSTYSLVAGILILYYLNITGKALVRHRNVLCSGRQEC